MALFFLLVMTLSRIHQHFAFLIKFRPALVVTMLAGAYAYMNPRYLVTGSIFRTFPAKAIAAMGIMACLSVPFGISMGGSGKFILYEYSKTLVLAFLLIAAIRNARDLYTFVWAFAISTGCLAYLSIFVFRVQRVVNDGFARIQNGYSYDSNDMGLVLLVGLVIALLTFQVSGKKGRLVSLLIIFGTGVSLARTGSRGAFLGLMAVAVALLILLKNVALPKRLAFIAVTGLGLLIAAPAGYWDQMSTLLAPKEDYNWTAPTGRKAVFNRGIGYMLHNPVTGIGIENFARAEGTLSDRAAAQADDPSLAGIKWSAAHDSFLQALAELGIPGFLIFCTLVFGSMISVIRLRRKLPGRWVRGDPEERFLYFTSVYLPVAYVGFAVSGFFVSFAYLDLIYVLAALTAGLFVSVEVKLMESSGLPSAPPPPAAPVHPGASRRVSPSYLPTPPVVRRQRPTG